MPTHHGPGRCSVAHTCAPDPSPSTPVQEQRPSTAPAAAIDDLRHKPDTPMPWLRYFFPKVASLFIYLGGRKGVLGLGECVLIQRRLGCLLLPPNAVG